MKYIGIDIGGTNIVAGLIEKKDNDYFVIKKESCETRAKDGVENIEKRIKNLYDKVLRKTNTHSNDINWVGIGVAGSVNVEKGIVGYSSNLFVKNWKLKENMENILKKRVVVLNDADAYAYGEFVAGSVRKANNALVLTIGTGIGCGIIINGSLYSSSNFAAGEVGHMIIEYNGRKCNCGKKGCFEAYASATGLVNMTIEAVNKSQNPEEEYIFKLTKGLKRVSAKTAFDAKKKNDELGNQIIKNYIGYLGTGITNLVNIFQPDKICIGGGVAMEGEYLLKMLREFVDENKYEVYPFKPVDILRARNCDTAGIIGAVAIGEVKV